MGNREGSGTDLMSLSVDDTTLETSIIKTNTYSYTDPKLASFSDGTKVLVWVEDDGVDKRPIDSNRTAIYYSVYNPVDCIWSDPAIVDQDYTADFNPFFKVVDDEALLVWMDANTEFESADI